MAANDKLRLDKWLWQARFFKTRTLAARIISTEGVRVDGVRVSKPSRTISPGDVLTFLQARRVRVVRVVTLGDRRGPASEAQALYEDLSPPEPKSEDKPPRNPAFEGKGRPTKRDRRNLDLNRLRPLE
ncbi:RNA-binding S4 domain-containing protein [Marinovum sp. 2_MG-2023]|uniref:RNA-binding S4 domain-containing protein n=1 Tax=unclassified Marinovum TaxID=2647166 RepID=UPI0026E320F9|nr:MULTISPECIES: RNA-binding S4 domain-containing protein [unclassified Marinovum]MDO6728906.1 RNA-binding S4 domain-containing protein [Marinovum sp. 2_MG-2023]MDO6777678.1 RNA-binding S4 domain-containing protein [Marinovum sp. 1_MG-2023]